MCPIGADVRHFREDVAFVSPNIYEFLETEDYKYAIRLKSNAVLQASISHLLTHPVGHPWCWLRYYRQSNKSSAFVRCWS